MTVIPADMCARCKHFKMKDYPEHARVGLGRCMGYDDATTPLKNPFTPWSGKPCARFFRAADVETRQKWIDKQLAKEQTLTSTATQQGEPER